MKSCIISIFTYNRPWHLRLCLKYLLPYIQSFPFKIHIVDDGSTLPEMNGVFDLIPSSVLSMISKTAPHPIPKSVSEGAARIGARRKFALDWYLRSTFDYCLFLDDDIITTPGTVAEAIRDFEFLAATTYAKVGLMTLHGQTNSTGSLNVGGKVFSKFSLSGEASMLFERKRTALVGNHFGEHSGGFGDTQIKAVAKKGLRYYERTKPSYEIQHIGYGNKGSVIHCTQAKPPIWNVRPFVDNWRHNDCRPIKVMGFNVDVYSQLVSQFGGDEAPKRYLEMSESLESKSEDLSPMPSMDEVCDKLEPLSGELEIRLRRADSGEIEKVISLKNIVVTNTRMQISRLIAGYFESDTRYIQYVGIGTSDTPAAASDDALTNMVQAEISDVTFPTAKSVNFVGTIPANQGNGVDYAEAGLVFGAAGPAGSVLATRVVFDPMRKSSLWAWEISWTLSFP